MVSQSKVVLYEEQLVYLKQAMVRLSDHKDSCLLISILLGGGRTFRRWGQIGVSWDALGWIIGDSFE